MYSTALEYFVSIWPCVILIKNTFVLASLGVTVTHVVKTAAAMVILGLRALSSGMYRGWRTEPGVIPDHKRHRKH